MVYLLWLFSQNVIFKDLKKNLSLYLLLLIYHLNSHARFENKQKPLQFLEILNKEDSSIQYTVEFENNQKQLNFLDITITDNGTDSYDFKIFRKPTITNALIKSNSNMTPNVSVSVFTGCLSWVCKICSERYIDKEFQFLMMYSQRTVIKENFWKRWQKIL